MRTTKCNTCEKEFETRNDVSETPDRCYDCCLEHITKGMAPEEGDYNWAALHSGEMDDAEAGWLREDLESVEAGSGHVDPLEDESDFFGCPCGSGYDELICHKCEDEDWDDDYDA